MNGAIEVLRLEISADRASFESRVGELEDIALSSTTCDPNILARAAVALHHAYGAVESALARIARVFGTEPSGLNWHRSLLETMTLEVPGIRPALLSPAALPHLRDLLAFRHFFRHGYAVPLEAARLSALRDRTVQVRAILQADFDRLDAWLGLLATKT